MQIRFTKMHGAMNDYIYVDCFAQRLEGVDLPRLAREISDRHRGVGSDGLILIAPPTPGATADVRMEMYNSDGSRGEMCGNGIRCVAKYAIEHGLIPDIANGSRGKQRFASDADVNDIQDPELRVRIRAIAQRTWYYSVRVQTDRGVLSICAWLAGNCVDSVEVGMGMPILEPAKIPVTTSGEQCIGHPIDVEGRTLAMTCVSMGNPHAVFFVESGRVLEALKLDEIGPRIERHPLFPNRTNVHFVHVVSRCEAAIRTWERGAGLTMACGTGACAAHVAAVLEDRMDWHASLYVPGGTLHTRWNRGEEVFMSGPAEEVFSGTWRVAQQG